MTDDRSLHYAVATSGGKDSTLALYRAQRQGLRVTHVLHLYGTEHGRVRFHGYRPDVIAAQARALGLDAIIAPSRSDRFDEDFTAALGQAREAGVGGVIFGNIHLQDVGDYYRRLVEGAGLEHREMLWHEEPLALVTEFVESEFRAVVTSVWLKLLGREFLGRELDRDFIAHISKLDGMDPCGERGEYHTLCYDGPCFREPLRFTVAGEHEEPDYLFLDLRLA
jgi:uncharacterized protein (TIGR00290 family)